MMPKKLIKLLSSGLLAICAALAPVNAKAELMINEIMQSNIDCIMDNFNEFPDSWVEIYNPDSSATSLNGYSIGISDDPTKAFPLLPSYSIPGEGYRIIYCDKENNINSFHTDFRLESGKGCAVYLFKNNEIVDVIKDLKKQPAPNVAYGRKTDGSASWGYQKTPTPGAVNCGVTVKDILPEPIFSHPGKVSTDKISLSLSLPESAPENAIIRYTLDCSEPNESSTIYNQPITVNASTIVRAKIFADNYLSPRSTTHSYIFHDRDLESLPLISLVSDNEYFYGDQLGILSDYVGDKTQANYKYDWRRPLNFEFFSSAKTPSVLNQLCETRLKGHGSRDYFIKSMVIYANKRFGTKRLDYEFFPDQKPALTDFKSIELRNAGNDCNYTYMKDAIIQQSMGLYADLDWQAYQPAVVYLNGKYHGILNIRERGNEDNIYTNYDGMEDVDIIENWSTAAEGSFDDFADFINFYSGTHTFEEYAERMDIQEYINYMIMNIFFSNMDFPGNNAICWKPQEKDGKWRWIAKDTDLGLGLYKLSHEFDSFGFIFDHEKYPYWGWVNKPEYSLLFRQLLALPEFRKMFIDSFCIYMGDFLTPANILNRIDNAYTQIKNEFKIHQDKNVYPEYRNLIALLVNDMKKWVKDRHAFMPSLIQQTFDLGNPVSVSLKDASHEGIVYSLNGISLTSQNFNGYYYFGETLHVESSAPELIKGWKVKSIIDDSHSKSIAHYQPTLELTIPDYKAIEIYPIFSDSGVEGIDADYDNNIDFSMPFDVYTLSGYMIGNSTQNLDKGIYIIRQGNKSLKYSI